MAFTTEQAEAFRQGRELLTQKKYHEALKLFEICSTKETLTTMTALERLMVLDHGAMTFVKLGDLKSALRYGRLMIKVHKGHSQGYLRTGPICEQLEKHELALAIYKNGLETVSPSEPNFAYLQAKHERMLKLFKKRRRVDPMQLLPAELVELIMKHASFAERLQLLRVSTTWRATLTTIGSLWAHLDLTAARRSRVSASTVQRCMMWSGNKISRASIFLSKKNGAELLTSVIVHCATLNQLDIVWAPGFSEDILLKSVPCFTGLEVLVISGDPGLAFDTVLTLLESCQNLTRAEFNCVRGMIDTGKCGSTMDKLRSLTINADVTKGEMHGYFTGLCSRIPNVEHLCLKYWYSSPFARIDFTMLKNLRHLDLSDACMLSFPWLPESIQTLNMSDCNFRPMGPHNDAITHYRLPDLTELYMERTPHLKIDGLRQMLMANRGNLKALNLNECGGISHEDIISLINDGYLESIVSLRLAYSSFDDLTAQLLAKSSPRLMYLDVDVTKITGVGVKAVLLKAGCQLESLKLNQCFHVAKDAVEFARSRGVKIQYCFYDGSVPSYKSERRLL